MSILKLFKILISQNKIKVLLAIFLSLATIMSSVGLFALSAYIISFCALRPSIADIAVAVVGVRFFGISRGGFRYLERLVSHNTTFSLLSRLRVWIYEKIEKLDTYNYLSMVKGDVFTRIIDDVEVLQEFYLRTFTPYIVSIVVGVSGVVFLFFFSKLVALSFLAFYFVTIFLIPILLWYFTKGLYKSLVTEKSIFKVKLLDILTGLEDLLGSSALGRGYEELEKTIIGNENIAARIALWRSLANALILLITNLAMVLCLAIGASLANGGKMNGVYLAVIALSTAALFEGTQSIPMMLQRLEQSKAAGDRIFEIDNVPIKMKVENKGKLTNIKGIKKVELKNIDFRYPNQEEPTLKGVSMECEVGKKIAIVGPSGCGKTTLFYILLKWLSINTGAIEINGVAIEEYSEEAIASLYSVVNQQVYFFNTSIRNNLLIGNSNATEEELEKALQLSKAMEFIEALPLGLDTEIGEGGMKLSGGQRQRLAIARALLKASPFLILDEPTAGLDAKTEKNLLEGIYSNIKDKGIIIITHRLVAMEKMDEILVMRSGQILERGTHSKLMELGGEYAAWQG